MTFVYVLVCSCLAILALGQIADAVERFLQNKHNICLLQRDVEDLRNALLDLEKAFDAACEASDKNFDELDARIGGDTQDKEHV